jgi:calcineurin-like phosphoesterase family protein/flagellar hook capping protein FlgD/purple acid phosphatase-like protein
MIGRRAGAWRVAVAACACLAPSIAGAAAITRGPYLQMGAPSSITVRWRTDVPTDGRVRFGPSPFFLTGIASHSDSTTEHEIRLQGLAPGNRYYYSVGTIAATLAGDSTYTFVMAPQPGTLQPVRIWVLGDAGIAGAGQARVRDAYQAWTGEQRTDAVLMLGDNAYGSGTDAQYQAAVFNLYASQLRRSVLWPTRGNHDQVFTGAGNDYYDFFTLPTAAEAGGLASGSEAYYSFDHANIHFICLDSEGSDRTRGGAMMRWLADDVAATQRAWVIAFWHHPPYSKGSHDSDNPGDSGGRMSDMRQIALPILDSAGVDLVLTGHSHNYERSFLLNGHYGISTTLLPTMILDGGDGRPDGTGAYNKPTGGQAPLEGAVYTVAGTSGQTGSGTMNHPVMVTSMALLGSVVLDVHGNQLKARFLGDTAGVVRDSFVIVKGSTGVPPRELVPPPVLLAPEPNPFGETARMQFDLPRAASVEVSILDALGRRVTTLARGPRAAGRHEVIWDGQDEQGRTCAAGVYYVVLEAGNRTEARKLVRVR